MAGAPINKEHTLSLDQLSDTVEIQSETATLARRTLLGRVLAVVTAAGAGSALVHSSPSSAGAAPIAAKIAIKEDPAIMAIGVQIGPMVSAWRDADNARLEAREWVKRLSPPVPPELLLPHGHPWRELGDESRDVEGGRLAELPTFVGADGRKYCLPPDKIFNSKIARAWMDELWKGRDGSLEPHMPAKVRRLIDRAEKYERECLSATQVSGIREALDRLDVARRSIDQLATKAARLHPRTWAGVAIFAQLAILPDELGDKELRWMYGINTLITTALARAAIGLSHDALAGAA